MLFVSGEKPERFVKAMAAGADLVCIDLEDAVAPARKEAARADALHWLAQRSAGPAQPAVALRLNAVRTLEGLRDVLALAQAATMPDWILLPKVEAAADVQCIHAWLGARCPSLVALLETPGSIDGAAAIAEAGGPLAALMLGGADLSAELGAQFGWDALLYARARILHAARAADLQAWDVPHIDLQKPESLADETRRVLALGFDCKTAIHPQQIPVIHDAFMPPAERIEWALALRDALPAEGASGAFMFRGGMVDAPVVRNALRILARAGQR
ncbi:CoA ester lyase [Variovorax sp. dw_308]|uniref:HpcH/HpaI aldolase/citrate lyase family protein n=1 Tax=Variovorax sp. dw_308 TaxID=2721546 RepID=UPI00210B9192|nr:CoA ester lyase [Variovorax sp. dw_308]